MRGPRGIEGRYQLLAAAQNESLEGAASTSEDSSLDDGKAKRENGMDIELQASVVKDKLASLDSRQVEE